MKLFSEFFPITAFRGVVLYEVLNPRVEGHYDDPAIREWYAGSHANWENHCAVPIESFVRAVVASGVLKPIVNQCGRDNYISAQWDQLRGGLYEPASLLNRTLVKFLRHHLMFARHYPDLTLDQQYDEVIRLMDSGTIDWSQSDISSNCERTGQHMWLDILNWEPRWGTIDSTIHFHELPVLEPDSQLRTVEVNFPSGRMLTNDWFRIDGFTDAVKEDTFHSINTGYGKVRQTEYYANKFNFVNICAGDMSIHPFSKDDGEVTSYLVFNRGDGTKWDNDTDEELYYEGDAFDHGSICTDLWAASAIDYDTLVEILTPTHGDKTRAKIDAWIASEMWGPEIQVEPGRYLIRYSPDYSYFPEVAKREGFDVFDLNEPVFTMTKIS